MAVAAFERLTGPDAADPDAAAVPTLAGYYAIDSLRLEKGYRVWGRELTPDTTPVEAGLAFTCKDRSPVGFRGADAVRRHRAEGVTRRLASFVIDDPEAYAWGGELLLRDGEPAGFASSAAFGHTLGRPVLLGYVERRDGGQADPQWLKEGRYQVVVGGAPFDAAMTLRAPYDPDRARVLA
jgi:4-methylaminobutanoate oxidase (formaldehyde-forming)